MIDDSVALECVSRLIYTNINRQVVNIPLLGQLLLKCNLENEDVRSLCSKVLTNKVDNEELPANSIRKMAKKIIVSHLGIYSSSLHNPFKTNLEKAFSQKKGLL